MRSTALSAKPLPPLAKCGPRARRADNVLAGAGSGVMLVSALQRIRRRRPPDVPSPRRRQRVAEQVAEIAETVVKQTLDIA